MTTFQRIPPIGAITSHSTGKVRAYNAIATLMKPHLDGMDEPERVNVFWEGRYTDMFVGERSAINNVSILNVRATEIYRNNIIVHEPGTDPDTLPSIFGPALLFDRTIWK